MPTFKHSGVCKTCTMSFTTITRSRRKPDNCSAECANKARRQNCGWFGKSLEDRLGIERSKVVRQAAANANTGKKRTPETKVKMRSAMHTRMIEHPESLTSHGIKGWYKGFFFRSSYEYFFMKKLESTGLSIKNDVIGESFRVPYIFDGSEHIYIPDIFVPKHHTVYEVKATKSLQDLNVIAKVAAAQDFFSKMSLAYVIITQHDLDLPSPKKIRSVLTSDPCVFLLPKHDNNDRLWAMFTQQDAFMKLLAEKRTFPIYPLDLSKKENQRFIKDVSHDCMHELFEAVHLLKNAKLHRATEIPEFDRDGFVEELADVAHYLVEIFILLGISPKEAFAAFMKKGTINVDRILTNY